MKDIIWLVYHNECVKSMALGQKLYPHAKVSQCINVGSHYIQNVVVDCGSPGVPINGSSNVTMTTFGSVAYHSCDNEFLLCGSENRTCEANGLWSESLPDCISK